MASDGSQRAPRAGILSDPAARSIATQVLLCLAIAFLLYSAASNAIDNLTRARIATGFAFWNNNAGFDISQTLIEYSASASTYGRVFWVGLLNTLLVASIGIVLATILGFAIGIARLSSNWLVARAAGAFVEIVRNIPLLLQLLFWYNSVLKALPATAESLVLPGAMLLNNRGLFLPKPSLIEGGGAIGFALLGGIAATIVMLLGARVYQRRTGRQLPRAALALVFIVLPLLAATFFAGIPVEFTYPERTRFNVVGGIEILPEFAALLIGLVVYTAAFIAEVVRAGLMAVPRGQSEAAASLGLKRGPSLRLVVIPQAMRVIIPPLISQHLALLKNSSFAVAIGYPDLVQVFAGTVLNQTGQAVEVVAVTMAVYLFLSLVISLGLNLYSRALAASEARR